MGFYGCQNNQSVRPIYAPKWQVGIFLVVTYIPIRSPLEDDRIMKNERG